MRLSSLSLVTSFVDSVSMAVVVVVVVVSVSARSLFSRLERTSFRRDMRDCMTIAIPRKLLRLGLGVGFSTTVVTSVSNGSTHF